MTPDDFSGEQWPDFSDGQRFRFGRALELLLEPDRLSEFLGLIQNQHQDQALEAVGLDPRDVRDLDRYLKDYGPPTPFPGMWAPRTQP